MKLVFILLTCFISVTWQEDVYWPFPLSRRFSIHFPKTKNDPHQYTSPKLFAVTGYQFRVLSKLLASMAFTASVTKYVTISSKIKAISVTTCYTKTMFTSVTACRRKRNILDRILVGDVNDEPLTQHEPLDGFSESLPREGRDMDPSRYIESSQLGDSTNFGNSYTNKLSKRDYYPWTNFFQTTTTVTSTVTLYAASTSISVKTNSVLAGASSLSCVPSGFSLC